MYLHTHAPRIWSWAVVILAISAATARAEWKYYFYDEPRVLTLDTKQIAVLDVDGGARAAGLADRLATFGIANGDISPWPIAGWNLVAIPSPSTNEDGVSALVTQITEAHTVEFVTPVFIGDDGGPIMVTRDILVGFQPSTTPDRAEEILRIASVGAIQARNWEGMTGAYRIRSNASNGFDVLAAANRLAEMPEVHFAEPNMIFTGGGSFFPNDAGFGNCWGLHNTGQFGCCVDQDMDAPAAWDITTGDPSIVVVVIDTGVQQNHPDINQRSGNDFTSDASSTGDPVNQFDNHGTPVAGCVSASINNVIGTVGVAPDCLSASARTFISTNANGNWTSNGSWTVAALTWAESIGARVTNNSNFYGFTSSAIASKYNTTRNNGMVHFASAGNESSSNITYPSSLPTVNAIVALTPSGVPASFSNFGNGIAFGAPGEGVYTTDRTGSDGWVNGDYVFANGTSFASPYAAGVAALMLSVNPTLDAFQIEQRFQTTSVDLGAPGYDTVYGWGFANAEAAVQFDCNNNGILDHIDIANGAPDCNSNGIPDECDEDCNDNLTPDNCEAFQDCNSTSIPDECEIASGASLDCNLNTLPDECDISSGAIPDCQPNNVPDDCDIELGGSLDTNGNGIPDECDTQKPTLAAGGHDRRKNRFISFNPNNPNIPVAIRVTWIDQGCSVSEWDCLGDFDCPAGESCVITGSAQLGWLQEPIDAATLPFSVAPVGTFVSLVGNDPVVVDWTGHDLVHIMGCHIAPVQRYTLTATADPLSNLFTPPLILETIIKPGIKFWGDLVGRFDGLEWTVPNGLVNVDDVSAVIKFITLKPAPHVTAVDLAGEVPNFIINAAELQFSLLSFNGIPYPPVPFANQGTPADCP